MPKATPSFDILKQFAALEKKAAKQVQSAKASIDKKIAKEIAAVHKKYRKEVKQIESMLGRFGATKAPNVKKAPSGKRTRRSVPKLTDEDIKAKLSQILAGGRKVSSAVIFSDVPLARPRFTAFVKANSGFIAVEGNKRGTLYSLRG